MRPTSRCLPCKAGDSTTGKRKCPVNGCRHEFGGKGWEGIDAHWRAEHNAIQPYEEFWKDLCDAHRGR